MTAPYEASAFARASDQELAFVAASRGGALRLSVSMLDQSAATIYGHPRRRQIDGNPRPRFGVRTHGFAQAGRNISHLTEPADPSSSSMHASFCDSSTAGVRGPDSNFLNQIEGIGMATAFSSLRSARALTPRTCENIEPALACVSVTRRPMNNSVHDAKVVALPPTALVKHGPDLGRLAAQGPALRAPVTSGRRARHSGSTACTSK